MPSEPIMVSTPSKRIQRLELTWVVEGDAPSDQTCRTTIGHMKRSSPESTISLELHQAKRPHKSLDPSDLERWWSESNPVQVSSTVTMEDLQQLVQEIKEMQVQLESIKADVALQGKVLAQSTVDHSCRVCRGDVERGHSATDWSDAEESQDPVGMPFFNY